tara:strand:+ start:6004 stop:6450 length:447 start_codon:yes stop_codon:yes gene_type:complete
MDFKAFLEQNGKEENKSVREALKKLPEAYRKLVRGFKFKFLDGSTLHGDSEHVGYMTNKPKVIAVAGPWHYGREFTLFHEIAHLVWEQLVDKEKRAEWKKVYKATKDKHQHQGLEEMFCMAFANFFAKNKVVIHDHDNWKEFIKGLIK